MMDSTESQKLGIWMLRAAMTGLQMLADDGVNWFVVFVGRLNQAKT